MKKVLARIQDIQLKADVYEFNTKTYTYDDSSWEIDVTIKGNISMGNPQNFFFSSSDNDDYIEEELDSIKWYLELYDNHKMTA